MEASTTCNVSDMPQGERATIEQLLGRPLSGDQTVFIMAFTSGTSATADEREAARKRLKEQFQSQAQRARQHGVTDEEADAAIEEAMCKLRPRPE
ncbi:MAG: hypothetical protein MI757_09290 [Pirellulales bacterium]|nr:hypothetical protein [Pirellulales bacterium]